MRNLSTGDARPTIVRRRTARALAGFGIGIVALLAAACGTASATGHTRPTKASIEHTCTAVSDALADGPDPDADPVGYALAQVRPLRAIRTTDTKLQKDIDSLASAYQEQYQSKNKKGSQSSVNLAGKALDTICPGAF